MATKTQWLPQEISDLDNAFPARVSHLMPPMAEIPKEFCDWNGQNKWQKLVSAWFFAGVKLGKVSPKEGIDTKKALRHIQTIMGSFEPKHEHKEAACAYLLSLWFDDIQYERQERTRK